MYYFGIITRITTLVSAIKDNIRKYHWLSYCGKVHSMPSE